ncbi:hypothetical protein ACJ73_05532 [Blastomyces percursus]|uniref:Protein kinase domain-containing protein n=1 Tax=Blastomyces percursus TaxID=1658174 RepID=A0A1J9Q3I4_9EURO|nr:hypothetical protein ACJ73_05532 [Blastomyces percursus]
MTTLLYESPFASEPTEVSGYSLPATEVQTSDSSRLGMKALRTDDSIFVDDNNGIKALSRQKIGSGTSFIVERAEWIAGAQKCDVSLSRRFSKWGKYIAVGSVRGRPDSNRNNWSDVPLELRALLHKPLRYHPNIVHLLGFGWGSSAESDSTYPKVIIEYATFGSFCDLQVYTPPLPFAIKQKLCHDIARGLAILHACGIFHGDLKHENVLIFANNMASLKGSHTLQNWLISAEW